jgi:hypothetical protein
MPRTQDSDTFKLGNGVLLAAAKSAFPALLMETGRIAYSFT